MVSNLGSSIFGILRCAYDDDDDGDGDGDGDDDGMFWLMWQKKRRMDKEDVHQWAVKG